MDLPITNLTWSQLALGLWLIPAALCIAFGALIVAGNLFDDVKNRSKYAGHVTYGEVLFGIVLSSIPVINVLLLIFGIAPDVYERFGRFVGFVCDALSKPVVPAKAKE